MWVHVLFVVRLLVGPLLVGAAAIVPAAAADEASPILRIETARHNSRINDAAADAAARTLITVGDDKTARIWSLPALRPLGVLRPAIGPGALGTLYAVALSADGSLAAVGGYRAEVLLFDVRTRSIVRQWAGVPDSVLALAFSCDGSKLAVGFGAGGLNILRVADGAVLAKDPDYAGGIYGLAFACNGLLAASSLDGSLRLYDRSGNKIIRIATQAGRRPTHLRFSPDSKLLAIGFNDAMAIEVRDGMTLEPSFRPSVSGVAGRSIEVVSWSASGRTLYAGGATTSNGASPVYAWDGNGRGTRRIIDPGFPSQVAVIAPLAGDGMVIASIDSDMAVTNADGRRAAQIAPLKADFEVSEKLSHPSRGFRLSNDGTTVEWVPLAKAVRYDLFDAGHLAFDEEIQKQPFLTDWAADDRSLHATDWDGGKEPRLNGTPLPLDRNERAESVALRDGRVLLGTQWRLRLFDEAGRPVWATRLPAPAWRVNQSADGRLAVAALGDGTLRWYRLSDGKALLAVFLTHDGERWIAFTPSGYYAASLGAEDLIGWHLNQAPDQVADFFPASRFRDQFYRPDIVRLVLSTLDEPGALRQADAARGNANPKAAPIIQDLPPVLTILSPGDGTQISAGNAEIDYAVRSPSGRPVRNVRVLIDGLPVPEAPDAGHEALPQPATRDGEAHASVRISIPPGRSVTVALLADTDSRTSEPAKVVLIGPAQTAARRNLLAPRLNALLIGVSDYKIEKLRHGVEYAADDATAIKAMLERQRDRGLYREVNTKLLVDRDATREAVIDALDWLSRETSTNDISVVFLAGHGVNEEGRVSFLPVGGDTDRVAATGLSQADMLSLLGRVVGRKVAFLDFCHAGGAVLAQNTRGDDDVDIVGLMNQLREPGSGLIVFAAATAREFALQLADRHHGAFTVALLEALDGGADLLRKGSVTTGELNVFLGDRLRILTAGKQHPIMEKADDVPDFPLVVTR
jgi:WD40 repeat protein